MRRRRIGMTNASGPPKNTGPPVHQVSYALFTIAGGGFSLQSAGVGEFGLRTQRGRKASGLRNERVHDIAAQHGGDGSERLQGGPPVALAKLKRPDR